MGALEYIFGSALILFALIIIFVVLLQEGRQANMGVISGAAESFMDKGAAKSLDQKLSKWTKVIAAIFFALVLTAMLVTNLKGDTTEAPEENTGVTDTNDVELDWSETESDAKDDADKKEETEHVHTDACDHD